MMRRYELRSDIAEAAHAADLDKLVDKLTEDLPRLDSLHWDAEAAKYFRSPAFRKLSDEEKRAAARVLRVFDDNDDLDWDMPWWRVPTGGTDDSESLFQIDGSVTVEADLDDEAVLSGALGGYVINKAPRKTAKVLNQLPPLTLRERLVVLGAVAVNTLPSFEGASDAASYTRSGDYGLQTTIAVGGTVHGDFLMSERRSWTQGAIAPTGEHVPIAPRQKETMLKAYHSVEISILFGILKHVRYSGHFSDYKAIYTAMYERLVKVSADGQRKGNFGDFGDADARTHVRRLKALSRHPDSVDMSLPLTISIVEPGSSAGFFLESREQGVAFRQTNEGIVTKEICIPDNELVDFVGLLSRQTSSGMGRTSLGGLGQLMVAAMELDEKE